MNVEITKDFEKQLRKLKNPTLTKYVATVVKNILDAKCITDINNIKKLVGHKDYFRIRIGDYRIGIYLDNKNTIWLSTIAHRKDIYTFFP
ncbi:MAG: type II toxin-antitoxin system RelE/ParE family toxin [Chitinophagales bacterium]